MAKQKPKRGRPAAETPLTVRVLVRFDKATGEALAKYSKQSGIASDSTAARVLVVDGLKRAGLL
jgi:hypothetical protein